MTLLQSPSIRVNAVIGTGHFLSHFYQLCLPPMFLAWQSSFGVSFAELGLSIALMSCAAGLLQTPVGFLVDRYGARPFLVCGALLMSVVDLRPGVCHGLLAGPASLPALRASATR